MNRITFRYDESKKGALEAPFKLTRCAKDLTAEELLRWRIALVEFDAVFEAHVQENGGWRAPK